MAFNFGGAVNGAANRVASSPILRGGFGNAAVAAIIVTIIALAVVYSIYRPCFREGGSRKAIRAGVYLFLGSLFVFFLHNHILAARAKDTPTYAAYKELFAGGPRVGVHEAPVVPLAVATPRFPQPAYAARTPLQPAYPAPSQPAYPAPSQAPPRQAHPAPSQAPSQAPPQAPLQASSQSAYPAPPQAPLHAPLQAPLQAPLHAPLHAPLQAPPRPAYAAPTPPRPAYPAPAPPQPAATGAGPPRVALPAWRPPAVHGSAPGAAAAGRGGPAITPAVVPVGY